jgi:hypothetical protein
VRRQPWFCGIAFQDHEDSYERQRVNGNIADR